jgi:hypothetical protein
MGVSRFADRVWSHVTGLPLSVAERRLLMPTQCFVDDSYKTGGRGPYVLGGVVASASSWVTFSAEWEELLTFCPLQRNSRREFKYSQMRSSPDLAAFYRAISSHVLFILSFQFNRADLLRAMRRVVVPGRSIHWNGYENNFIFAFSHLMGIFHTEKTDIDKRFGLTEKVDFVFDDQREKRQIISGWEKFVESSPADQRAHFGAFPRFENSSEFLPLQAADLVAGHARFCFESGTNVEESELMQKCKGDWVQWAVMSMTEDQIVRRLSAIVKHQVDSRNNNGDIVL